MEADLIFVEVLFLTTGILTILWSEIGFIIQIH